MAKNSIGSDCYYLIVCGVSNGSSGVIFTGILIIALGIFLICRQFMGKPTDSEIDKQAQEVLVNLKQNALNKHGITEEEVKAIEPIILGGYLSSSVVTAGKTLLSGGLKSAAKQAGNILKTALTEEMQVKIGKDGIIRTSLCETTIFLFSEEQVFSYNLRYSLVSPINNDSTEEYYYKDFTSVSTESDSNGFHYLKMETLGGNSKSIPINSINDNITKSINAMKQKIRTKRA